MSVSGYRGRFAPTPSGPLHRGSLAAALASWLDARANQGKWLIRIENIDLPRERVGAAQLQLRELARFGMVSDEPVLFQDSRFPAYGSALQQLRDANLTFDCDCSRSRRPPPAAGATEATYPGTCRNRGALDDAAVRFRVSPGRVGFEDRACGWFEHDVEKAVGDFVVHRRDGIWAYQLAVVVDDAFQAITDVVRGSDLLDNTPRQILLQRALGFPTPRYLHIPLVCDASGKKLSKHDGSEPLLDADVLVELERAWHHLGFAHSGARSVEQFQLHAVDAWRQRWKGAPAQVNAVCGRERP